ncbi:hypothetical protein Aduo_010674 [Ancylostoma duodenale]
MFYFFVFSLLFLNILTQEGVNAYTPCLDKAGSSFCIKPFEKGMCHNEAVEELMKEPRLDKAGSSFCIKLFKNGMCHHEAVKELMQEFRAETCAFCP